MATEDYTTGTEVDANGVLTVTASRITCVDVDRDIDAYLYWDFGAGHFGNFEHLLTMHDDGSNNTSSIVNDWMMGNNVDDGNNVSGLHVMSVSGGSKIRLGEGTGFCAGNYDQYDYGNQGHTSYLTIERSGTTFTCKIYSDAIRSTLLDTLTLTVANTTYRYLYGFASHNSANAGINYSGYVENLDIQEAAGLSIPVAMHHYNLMR